MKKLFLFIVLLAFTSCGTVHKGTDVAGNKVTVVRDSKGQITKQIHKCENKKIVIVYNR